MFWSWDEEWEHLGYDLKGCEFKSQTQRLEAMLFQATYYGDYSGSIYTRGNHEYAKENWPSIADSTEAGHGRGCTFWEDRDPQELQDMVRVLAEFYEEDYWHPAFDEGWHDDWEYTVAVQQEMEEWHLPEFRKDVLSELDDLTDWGDQEEMVPADELLHQLWYEYADQDSLHEYFEGATSLVIEGAPDPAEVAMGILVQYAKDITTAGNPPELEGLVA